MVVKKEEKQHQFRKETENARTCADSKERGRSDQVKRDSYDEDSSIMSGTALFGTVM